MLRTVLVAGVFALAIAHLAIAQEGNMKCDEATMMSVQKDIERTLLELIDALEKAQKKQEGEGGGGGGGGGGGEQNEPLLPSSAELKLLRSAQLRVNRRTQAIVESQPEGKLDDVMKNELKKTADLQADIANMAEEMIEKY